MFIKIIVRVLIFISDIFYILSAFFCNIGDYLIDTYDIEEDNKSKWNEDFIRRNYLCLDLNMKVFLKKKNQKQ